MKKTYTAPVTEMVVLNSMDVITVSRFEDIVEDPFDVRA